MSGKPTPATGYQGTFHTPGSYFKRITGGGGTLVIQAADNARWLEIHYEEGERPLAVVVGNEPIHIDSGSKISFGVAKPSDGVSIHYHGHVKGGWTWLTRGNQASDKSGE